MNNAIVLVDYIELLKARRRKDMGLEPDAFLPLDVANECIIEGGKTRLRPVLLTAITTILGLLPLAVGLNIDFQGLFSELFSQSLFRRTTGTVLGTHGMDRDIRVDLLHLPDPANRPGNVQADHPGAGETDQLYPASK